MENFNVFNEKEKEMIIFNFNEELENPLISDSLKTPIIDCEFSKKGKGYYAYNIGALLDKKNGFLYQIPYCFGILSSLRDEEDIKNLLSLVCLQDLSCKRYFEKIQEFLKSRKMEVSIEFIKYSIFGIVFLVKMFGRKFMTEAFKLLSNFPLNRMYKEIFNEYGNEKINKESIIFTIGVLSLMKFEKTLKNANINVYEASDCYFWQNIENFKVMISACPDEEYKNSIQKAYEKIVELIEKQIKKEEKKRLLNTSEKIEGLTSFIHYITSFIVDKSKFNEFFENNNVFILSFVNKEKKNSVNGEGKAEFFGKKFEEIDDNKAPIFNQKNVVVREELTSYIKLFLKFYETYKVDIDNILFKNDENSKKSLDYLFMQIDDQKIEEFKKKKNEKPDFLLEDEEFDLENFNVLIKE